MYQVATFDLTAVCVCVCVWGQVTVTTTTTTTTPACADGEYRNGTTCTAKTEQASCNPGEKFTAGNNTDKTTDDAFCTECANGTYVSRIPC